MKQIILTTLAIITIFSAQAQKDSVVKADTLTIIPFQKTEEIIQYMQLQASGNVDVKSAVWQALINELYQLTKLIPNKEQPKNEAH